MPPRAHALLSASSSHRWLNCPPSARLCENYDDVASNFAIEGTCAHSLCEYYLKCALGIETEDPTENLSYYNEEMVECAKAYVSFITCLIDEHKRLGADISVLIERRLDYSKYVTEGFGTGDCIVIADNELHIIDYKHGKGVLVNAENNTQMQLYALGALEMFDEDDTIDTVHMTIFQPRKGNVATFTLEKAKLYEWAEEILKPTADLAFRGEGDYNCGEWCQFCKAKADCRERANTNLEMEKYECREPALLTDDEIAEILTKVDPLVSWANDIKAHAHKSALEGKTWKGFKLVAARSTRKYADEKAVAEAVINAGYDPYERRLLTITDMQKMLGKDKFTEVLNGLIIKPEGKPTLVPESDSRPAITNAKLDFYEE